MIGKALDFLFGKAPDIFDADGNVLHKFPPDKWQAWRARFQTKEYNWHQHKGSDRIPSTAPKTRSVEPKV